MSGINYGYVRVSTGRQDMGRDAQRRAVDAAGCAEIIEEQAAAGRFGLRVPSRSTRSRAMPVC